MEKDSLIILVAVVGLVAVSAFLGEMGITGKAVEHNTKFYNIEAAKLREKGVYSLDGVDFSLLSSESKTINGVMLSHISTLSSGVRFELSGACTNAYTLDVIYYGTDSSEEELAGFKVEIDGKDYGQFSLKEGESKALADKSKITLLTARRGVLGNDLDEKIGANFELACN
ncbi:hypothetical protein HYU08_03830 [Candidatus Woesearchaeota archaeon]|nr:hypothetical protein [Candidatus Woesearchaeota archaeon]